MVLKLYYDLMSQPARALTIFFRATKIPYEPCPVPLRKGAHKTPEYLQNINRFGRVPVIDHDGFKLTESVAILRYVTKLFPVDDHWYPKDIKGQARVDEFLEWHHMDFRLHLASYFIIKVIAPLRTGREVSKNTLERHLAGMNEALDSFEKHWLSNGTPYVIGNTISVADIFAACEIEQTRMGGYDPTEGRPKLAAWLQRIRSELEPYYGEAHVSVHRLAEVQPASSKL